MKMFFVRLVLGMFGDFLAQALGQLSTGKKSTDRLLTLALTHVELLDPAVMSNEAKRAAAIEGVAYDAERLGIEYRDWLVSMSVEAAVGKHKVNKKGKK